MQRDRQKLARRYSVALRQYMADEQEAILEEAYELGRKAIARGLGVWEMARVHQEALLESLQGVGAELARRMRCAKTFFLEALSPFEVTHRGFRETNLRLQELIKTLEKRNSDLGEMNRELASEIQERKRTEAALRESENHFRELFTEASRMEENLRNLSNQILHVQEEERKRISRELHDEVGQALTAISVTLATLKSGHAGISEIISPKLTDAQHLLQETMETVHSFARELRPTMLDELGLLPALRSYLAAFAERTGLRVRFRSNAVAEGLSPDGKTVLFRIAQESLTNVAKHAQASQAEILVRKTKDSIVMEVSDNGKSFQPNLKPGTPGKRRLGLLGMQERVRLVNGQFSIKAQPGKGTTVRVAIPLKNQSPLKRVEDRHRRARSPLASTSRRPSLSKPKAV